MNFLCLKNDIQLDLAKLTRLQKSVGHIGKYFNVVIIHMF